MERQTSSRIECRLYARILLLMEEKRPYLDPQFGLCELANLLCTNRTRLSSTLNSHAGMNFSLWLSTYRVNHLLKELRDHPEREPHELYKEAGFTSRTSFYRQFKKVTGSTPLDYSLNL